MLPGERTGQYKIEVKLRIPGEHLPICGDQADQVFSWLNCAMMKNVRPVDAQAAKQLLKQYWIRGNSIETVPGRSLHTQHELSTQERRKCE